MQFGISLSGMQRGRCDADMRQRFEELVRYVHAAEEWGYDYVSIGQHYLTAPYQMLQPVPLIGRLIAETSSLRMLTTLIAPVQHPAELAETYSTLDVLSGGRITLSLALGYRDEEYALFGVDKSRRVGRMVEVVECLRTLWTDGSIDHHGPHFHLSDVELSVRPVQRPHPPIWIAANADPAVVRAARWGLPWRINSHATFETIARQVRLYRSEYQPQENAASVALPLGREMYCAETREQAWEESRPHLMENYQRYADWGQDQALPDKDDFRVDYEELARDRFVIGDPADCRSMLGRYAELGIGAATLRVSWPGMPAEHALRSIELFAKEVIPHYR